MRRFNLIPDDPRAQAEQLEADRQAILGKIKSPLGRGAARLASHFFIGPLALNNWQLNHTKRQIIDEDR